MVHANKLRITNETALELHKRAQTINEIPRKLKSKKAVSREMQMVPVYLELATLKDKKRFNPAEIAELTGMIEKYDSKIPATDLIKRLLNIGIEKGEPLSIQEMKNFFLSTPLLDKKGQTRVIEFMEALKEKAAFKYDSDYIRKNNSFEKFKNGEVKEFPNIYKGKSEDELKKIYRDHIDKEIRFSRYKAYTSQFNMDVQDVSQFININNLEFVYGVANCTKPSILAEIVCRTGALKEVGKSSNELVQVYELSKGNIGLIQDLVRGFYPYEINQIATKLISSKDNKNLAKYYQRTYPSDYNSITTMGSGLAKQRKYILEDLGLTGQIDLVPIRQHMGVPTISGSFEQGKRR